MNELNNQVQLTSCHTFLISKFMEGPLYQIKHFFRTLQLSQTFSAVQYGVFPQA